MFGLHWAFIPIFINNMATIGFDSLMGLLAANQFAMAGAALAFGLRARDKQMKTLGISTGGTALLGVSEPALYGVLLPQKKTLIMAIIGGSVGGVIGGAFLSKVYAFAPSGVFGIRGAVNPQGIDAGFYGYVVQMLVGLVVGFILTYLWGYKTRSESAKSIPQGSVNSVSISDVRGQNNNSGLPVQKAEMTVHSPLSGEVVELASVADEAFSSEAMGKGVAIIPSSGTVVSPVEGVVTTITKSRHAIAVIGNDGVEVLIHVGLDTVKLKGEGFTLKVQEGDQVKVRDVMMEVDLAKIKEKGFQLITPVIITNFGNYSSVSGIGARNISAGAPVITVKV
ncbi:PTS glucose transporter subunit IIA [Paenibacillus sp. JNUCC31]|nr:PTS glucose transporter subunit IIA [Paenibacillus sp. JNUCC-31]